MTDFDTTSYFNFDTADDLSLIHIQMCIRDRHHWREDEKFSLLPNSVSDVIKLFWAQEPVLSERDDKAYLLNISGQAFGEFKIHSVSDLKRYNFTLPDYLQKYYDSYDPNQNAPEDGEQESPLPPDPMILKPIQKTGNMTKSSGKISLQISAYDYNYRNAELSKFIFNETTDRINDTVVARVAMSLKDYDEIESHDLETRGVYFQETGALVTITRSAKFLGTHGLSHMTLNEKNFNRAKVLLGQYLNFTDNERDLNLDNMNNNILRSRDSCEMISYFQFEKTDYTKQELQNIDEELIAPSGSPIPKDLPLSLIHISSDPSSVASSDVAISSDEEDCSDEISQSVDPTSFSIPDLSSEVTDPISFTESSDDDDETDCSEETKPPIVSTEVTTVTTTSHVTIVTGGSTIVSVITNKVTSTVEEDDDDEYDCESTVTEVVTNVISNNGVVTTITNIVTRTTIVPGDGDYATTITDDDDYETVEVDCDETVYETHYRTTTVVNNGVAQTTVITVTNTYTYENEETGWSEEEEDCDEPTTTVINYVTAIADSGSSGSSGSGSVGSGSSGSGSSGSGSGGSWWGSLDECYDDAEDEDDETCDPSCPCPEEEEEVTTIYGTVTKVSAGVTQAVAEAVTTKVVTKAAQVTKSIEAVTTVAEVHTSTITSIYTSKGQTYVTTVISKETSIVTYCVEEEDVETIEDGETKVITTAKTIAKTTAKTAATTESLDSEETDCIDEDWETSTDILTSSETSADESSEVATPTNESSSEDAIPTVESSATHSVTETNTETTLPTVSQGSSSPSSTLITTTLSSASNSTFLDSLFERAVREATDSESSYVPEATQVNGGIRSLAPTGVILMLATVLATIVL